MGLFYSNQYNFTSCKKSLRRPPIPYTACCHGIKRIILHQSVYIFAINIGSNQAKRPHLPLVCMSRNHEIITKFFYNIMKCRLVSHENIDFIRILRCNVCKRIGELFGSFVGMIRHARDIDSVLIIVRVIENGNISAFKCRENSACIAIFFVIAIDIKSWRRDIIENFCNFFKINFRSVIEISRNQNNIRIECIDFFYKIFCFHFPMNITIMRIRNHQNFFAVMIVIFVYGNFVFNNLRNKTSINRMSIDDNTKNCNKDFSNFSKFFIANFCNNRKRNNNKACQ